MRFILIFLLLFFSSKSFSYLEMVDTGELVPKNQYRAYGGVNSIFNSYDGINATGRFATGIMNESEVQVEMGVGSVDFQVGGYYKWVPIPDYESQPAVGGKLGVHYGRIKGLDVLNFSGTPIISKKFKTELGDFAPYGGLPVNVQVNEVKTNLGLALNLGTEWTTLRWNDIHFYFDLRLNLIETFSAVSVGVSYDFGG